ncbi:hypothetical protein VDT1_1257 [Vibrio sp. 16]|nr:hypothetical protein VPMS16_302 [Vibrio sp. 16]CAK4068620.1 hypothetical protein VDT1_1257 [Vibrio sp. 16]
MHLIHCDQRQDDAKGLATRVRLASDKALHQWSAAFFCQATPGGGKTFLAAEVAKRLMDLGLIDIALCFSPTKSVAEGIEKTFSFRLQRPFNGTLGSIGHSLTYQSIQYVPESYWSSLKNLRVFLVLDEVHHCSGNGTTGNSWGQQVIEKLQELAVFSFAMSGTPWRSDSLPIVLSRYTDPEGKLMVDYQYSLKQAVADGVCRSPNIVLVDNERLAVRNGQGEKAFSSILDLLSQTKTSYQSVIHNDAAIEYVLSLACNKLQMIRRTSPRAGALVVAASVSHTLKISQMLRENFNQSVSVVSYLHSNPLGEIEHYRSGDSQWIVSVGMISEGTDIPRLQVCCHLSAAKTELYFWQVLGRILRVTSEPNQEAWLYTFAEPSLIEFSERVEHDIPGCCSIVNVEDQRRSNSLAQHDGPETSVRLLPRPTENELMWIEPNESCGLVYPATTLIDEVILGRFKQRVIDVFR